MFKKILIVCLIVLFTPFGAKAQDQSYKRREFTYRRQPTPLPNFYFFDANGRQIQITHFRGKVVLLNIWGTGCPTCVVELPMFSRLKKDMKGKVEVIPLSVGSESIIDIMRMYQGMRVYNLDAYKDRNGRYTEMLRITRMPTTLLIDPDGREVGRLLGMAEWDGPVIKAQIKKVLKEYDMD